MVGRLNLRNVCDDDPLDMNFKADRPLDSPDSAFGYCRAPGLEPRLQKTKTEGQL
ncbi:hypothetical protein M9458_030465, partial [Cirrhinus mrigala]